LKEKQILALNKEKGIPPLISNEGMHTIGERNACIKKGGITIVML